MMAYQPIVAAPDARPPRLRGYEALWRPRGHAPGPALARLRTDRARVAQDLRCLAAAWAARPAGLSAAVPLHVNVWPATLDTPAFWAWLARVDPRALVVEVLETPWTSGTAAACARLARAGARVALDDVDGEDRWCALAAAARPAVLKLAAGFLDAPGGAARLAAVRRWAAAHRTRIIAEGVETAAAVAAYQAAGVTEFQGFFFARPLAAGRPPGAARLSSAKE
jgi:EAL domain-containing protein (putative c-di-GMP-specific phosphodiesterase class I)